MATPPNDLLLEQEKLPIMSGSIVSINTSLHECIICYDKIEEKNMITEKDIKHKKCSCRFNVHDECWKNWKKTKKVNTCLICRENIVNPEIIVGEKKITLCNVLSCVCCFFVTLLLIVLLVVVLGR